MLRVRAEDGAHAEVAGADPLVADYLGKWVRWTVPARCGYLTCFP